MSYNKITIVGNLGKDPELKTISNGKQVCKFSVATTSGYGDKKKTQWHNVVAWEKKAEYAGKYLAKGSKVLVEGRLESRSWESDGETKYMYEIIAFEVQGLSPVAKKDAQESFDENEEIPF